MKFSKLTDYLDHLAGHGIPGCELIVHQNYKEIYHHMTGTGKKGMPITGKEMYWLYSLTKVLTMSTLMRLMELGVFSLHDPVSRYLPSYKDLCVRDGMEIRKARTVMTMCHLMTMQGGLPGYDAPAIERGIRRYHGHPTTQEMTACFAEDPLLFDPGDGFRYGLCHEAAGAAAEAAAGAPLRELARELILDPLGIENLTFHPDKEQCGQLAAAYRRAEGKVIEVEHPTLSLIGLPEYDSGGAGLMGNAAAFIPLADALANGGVGANGARILTRKSIDRMRCNRQSGKALADFKKIGHKRGYGYGLGVRTLMDRTTSKSPVGEFGWDGAAGAYALMDPDNHIAAVLVQHVLDDLDTFYIHHPTIRDLIYEGLQ